MPSRAPIPYESRTLLVLRRRQLARDFEEFQRRIEREGLTDELRTEGNRIALLSRSADGHEPRRRRGVPIIGRDGPGGASPGTDPLGALLAKEARGELHL